MVITEETRGKDSILNTRGIDQEITEEEDETTEEDETSEEEENSEEEDRIGTDQGGFDHREEIDEIAEDTPKVHLTEKLRSKRRHETPLLAPEMKSKMLHRKASLLLR
jgi:hypothetical protein